MGMLTALSTRARIRAGVEETKKMEVVYPACAGLDLGKRFLVACALFPDERGQRQKEIKTFDTDTEDLRRLGEWLQERGVTAVAMESTGPYWKPVFNLLEERFECILVNPQHIKALPGRKTDVKDSEWIADLLRHGLLPRSFVPDREQRELRELVRLRQKKMQLLAAEANRLQKVLEGANIKLGSVASNVLGVSGREMLRALAEGEKTPDEMAALARGRLREKIPQLRRALDGVMADHQRQMILWALDDIEHIERRVQELDKEIAERTRPHEAVTERLMTVPGIGRRVAEVILAEVGPDAKAFDTPEQLASWAGLCPGNKSSAGKRLSGRIRPGNQSLKSSLVQASHAVSHSKNTYLGAQFRRFVRTKGVKRAAVAVAHTILVIVWHLLTTGDVYNDLGVNYLERADSSWAERQAVRRLERLGYTVSLTPKAGPAA